MDNQIKVIKKAWKISAILLVVAAMFFGGLTISLNSAFAHGYKSPTPSPSPSPSLKPTPSPSPTPIVGGQNQDQGQSQDQDQDQEQEQEQTQNNKQINEQENEQNQTVEINNTNNNTVNVPAVAGTTSEVPMKQPETGVSVLGLASMFSAGPVGIALSRFGRGRNTLRKKEENLAELAKGLVENRIGKSQTV